MNGEPLPPVHGYPVRMVVPGLYGYVSATKWLVDLELTTFDAYDPYWVQRGWAAEAPIKTMSRIDAPKPLARLAAGKVAIAGVAWAQHRGIDGSRSASTAAPGTRRGSPRSARSNLAAVGLRVGRTPGRHTHRGPRHRRRPASSNRTSATNPSRAARPDGTPSSSRSPDPRATQPAGRLAGPASTTARSPAGARQGETHVNTATGPEPSVGSSSPRALVAACSWQRRQHRPATAARVDGPSHGPGDGSVHGPEPQRRDDGRHRSARPAPSVPADGAGSFEGMAKDPVATAASNNPALSTLVTAVGAAGLGDTLNSAEDITVFAPANDGVRGDGQGDARRGPGRSDRSPDHRPHLPRRPGPSDAGDAGRHAQDAAGRHARGRRAAARTSPSTARPRSSAATSRPPTPPSTSSTACLLPPAS